MKITDFIEETPDVKKEKYDGTVVSYSQYKLWETCPLQWTLTYVDKNKSVTTIDTIFGTAMHETIQEWLPLYYNDHKRSQKWDLHPILKEKLIKLFKEQPVYKHSIPESTENLQEYLCDAPTLQEYYDDGCLILDHVQKYATEFFPSDSNNYKLEGCEIELDIELKPRLKFIAYLDIVIHDIRNNYYYIFDLKTSKSGWKDYQKKDKTRVNQILLYKKFYSHKFNVPMSNIFPRFIILKRKIYEQSQFPVKRLSNYEPSHGVISIKNASKRWEEFLTECFDENGNQKRITRTTPSEWNCKYCPFNNNAAMCSDSWGLKQKKQTEQNKILTEQV